MPALVNMLIEIQMKLPVAIKEFDREWDMERVLETNASALAFTGLVLGVTHNKKWLIVPGIVLPFFFQHAVQGWCPPVRYSADLAFARAKK